MAKKFRGRVRCFPNTGPLLHVEDIHAEVLVKLNKLIELYNPLTHNWPKDECLGLYTGPTSIAYLFFYFSESSGYEGTRLRDKTCAEWCQLYLDAAQRMFSSTENASVVEADEWGNMSEKLVHYTVSAALTKDTKFACQVLKHLPAVLERIPTNNDLTGGRAGYLYLLRLINANIPGTVPKDVFTQVIEQILQNGPPWESAGFLYTGTGHGWAGIITQILLSDATYAQQVQPVVEQLVDLQRESKNWPAKIHDQLLNGKINQKWVDDDLLVQFSHGAPGMVASLNSLLGLYAYDPAFQKRMQQAIDEAQDCIWKRGLLFKEPSLIHGAAGNALALKDPQKAAHFLAWSTEEVVERGLHEEILEPADMPSALMTGLAGRAYCFDAIAKGKFGTFLTYNEV